MVAIEKLPEIMKASPEGFKVSFKAAPLQFGVSQVKKQQEKAVEDLMCGMNVFT